jgi:hypothetical protein
MRRIPMICSSVNRFLFIVRLLERTQHYNEGISGEQVKISTEFFGKALMAGLEVLTPKT